MKFNETVNYNIRGQIFCISYSIEEIMSIDVGLLIPYLFRNEKIERFNGEHTLTLDANKLNIIISLHDEFLECNLVYKDYIGTHECIPEKYVKGKIRECLDCTILAGYMIITNESDNANKVESLSDDLRSSSSYYEHTLATILEVYEPVTACKFVYEYEDETLSLRKVGNVDLNKELAIRQGEVYVIEYPDQSLVYAGINVGTLGTELKYVEKGVLFDKLKSEGLL